MGTLPNEIVAVLAPFAPFFRYGIWRYAQVLVIGAILAPGKGTVTSVLRVMGLSQERQFQKDHRVLNRSRWSSLALSRVLLGMLVRAFVPAGEPIVRGVDETIERRREEKIAAKGIYRDPVRSSKSHCVKASGLRGVSMMLIAPIPWAQRFWALPFLTALAPSERYYEDRARAPKTLTDWGRQMIKPVRRWLPKQKLLVVAAPVRLSCWPVVLGCRCRWPSSPACGVHDRDWCQARSRPADAGGHHHPLAAGCRPG
ncbi:MAG: transposase [Ardenticatenaceae bacterium]|nr:transposase [Ardenticatenaceae bacterium]